MKRARRAGPCSAPEAGRAEAVDEGDLAQWLTLGGTKIAFGVAQGNTASCVHAVGDAQQAMYIHFVNTADRGNGAANAQGASAYLQQQYNAHYAQCMAARRPPPPPYYAPGYPPAPGYGYPPPQNPYPPYPAQPAYAQPAPFAPAAASPPDAPPSTVPPTAPVVATEAQRKAPPSP